MEEIERIIYYDRKNAAKKMIDWEKSQNGEYIWNLYVREYEELSYSYCEEFKTEAMNELGYELNPIAEKLGLDLEKFGDLRRVNVQRLVESIAKKANSAVIPTGIFDLVEIVEEYITEKGQIILLKKQDRL